MSKTWVVLEVKNEFGNFSVFDNQGCELFFWDRKLAEFFRDEFNRLDVYGKIPIDVVYKETMEKWWDIWTGF